MALFGNSEDNNGAEMSFFGHLEVLRWHLIRAAAAIVVFALVAFFFMPYIFDNILLAPKKPDFITFRALCRFSQMISGGDVLCVEGKDFKLISTGMSSQFSAHLYISLITGLVCAFPYVLWELWRFIKPALQDKERKSANGIIFYMSFLFFAGILFGYFIVSPLAANFLGNYQISEQIENLIDFDSYISIITVTTFVTGLVFELPIAVFVLSKLGLLTPKFMRTYRKHAVVIILIAAAVITPSPDVISQMLVALPLYLLYEISILVSGRVEKQRNLNAI